MVALRVVDVAGNVTILVGIPVTVVNVAEAVPDVATTNEDASVTIPVVDNDHDVAGVNDPLVITEVTMPRMARP